MSDRGCVVGPEERGIRRLHCRVGSPGKFATRCRGANESRTPVARVGMPLDEALALKNSEHLRSHPGVGAGDVCELDLGEVIGGPGERGEEYELHVGEVERLQRRADGCLPPVGDAPEHESRAVLVGFEAAAERIGHGPIIAASITAASRSVSGMSPRRS